MKTIHYFLLKSLTLLLMINLLAFNSFSQGTAINTTGNAADNSAMLDVSSTNKGFLMPRMTEADRTTIVNPAKGLLVYQTDKDAGFWFYDGTTWQKANAGDNLGDHTATADLNMSNKKIINLEICTDNAEAANKEYVDNAVSAGGGAGSSKPSMISDESSTAYTYAQAVQYCENLNESGYTDWRMPDAYEIQYFSGITGASSNFLWTKTQTKPQMYPDNQNFETVRLSDGKWEKGIIEVMPFVGKSINGTSNSTTFNNIGTISPNNPNNILYVTHIQLLGMGASSGGQHLRIKYNYDNGTSYTSADYRLSRDLRNNFIFDWSNIEHPIVLTSIELEGITTSTSYSAYGTLSISGYEAAAKQKDGNTIHVRCVR